MVRMNHSEAQEGGNISREKMFSPEQEFHHFTIVSKMKGCGGKDHRSIHGQVRLEARLFSSWVDACVAGVTQT